MRAFANGTDGIFIGGCHLCDCHYVTNGNFNAYSMVQVCKKIMEEIGILPERLRLEWVSAGEGIRFANFMNEYSAELTKLGPIGKAEGIDEKELALKLEAVRRIIPYIKLVLTQRFHVPVRTEDAYHEFFNSAEFNRLFDELIADKLAKSLNTASPQKKSRINGNERIDQIIDKHQGEASSLIQILLEIQGENRWLPREVLERVSERLKVPFSRAMHIASFYKAFSLEPKGRHEVHICMGTACHVRGAKHVLETAVDHTGLKPGETDADMKFSLETVNCLGCCALGPVMEINGKTHGKLSAKSTADVLKSYE
jgi:NADH-quinone oxidoreductase subunit E